MLHLLALICFYFTYFLFGILVSSSLFFGLPGISRPVLFTLLSDLRSSLKHPGVESDTYSGLPASRELTLVAFRMRLTYRYTLFAWRV